MLIMNDVIVTFSLSAIEILMWIDAVDFHRKSLRNSGNAVLIDHSIWGCNTDMINLLNPEFLSASTLRPDMGSHNEPYLKKTAS